MRNALGAIALTLAMIATPLLAQPQPNQVLTGVDGLPWGASRAQIEARFGAPDSVHTRGDTINLIYLGQTVVGKSARMMDVLIAPAAGMASVAYLIEQTPGSCVAALDEVAKALAASLPGLRAEPYAALAGGAASTDIDRICGSFAQDEDHGVLVSQTLRDPVGPASVFMLNAGTRRRGTALVVHFRSADRGRRR